MWFALGAVEEIVGVTGFAVCVALLETQLPNSGNTIGTNTLFIRATHGISSTVARLRLHFADLVTIGTWLARVFTEIESWAAGDTFFAVGGTIFTARPNTVAAFTLPVCATEGVRRAGARRKLHATLIFAISMRVAGDTLEEEISLTAQTLFGIMCRTTGGGCSDTLGTFAGLHIATLAILGLCTISFCLISNGVAVGPSLALVVAVQPIQPIALHTPDQTVDRTSQARGASTVVTCALLSATTLRVGCVGRGLDLHLALLVAIPPWQTQALV